MTVRTDGVTLRFFKNGGVKGMYFVHFMLSTPLRFLWKFASIPSSILTSDTFDLIFCERWLLKVVAFIAYFASYDAQLLVKFFQFK